MSNAPFKEKDLVKVVGDVTEKVYEITHISSMGDGPWDVLLKGNMAIVPHTMLIPA